MPEYSEISNLPYSCESVFELVLDIERYPEFVPGCRKVRVLERGDSWLRVEQEIGIGPARLRFVSQARFEHPVRITIESSARPFRRLRIDWTIRPAPDGCQIEFNASVELAAMNRLAAPLTAQLGRDVLAAFRRRAALDLKPGD